MYDVAVKTTYMEASFYHDDGITHTPYKPMELEMSMGDTAVEMHPSKMSHTIGHWLLPGRPAAAVLALR